MIDAFNFSPFELGFLRAQLWSGTMVTRKAESRGFPEFVEVGSGQVGDKLDAYIPKIISSDLVKAVKDCASFLRNVERKFDIHLADYMANDEQAGHNFCLARNESGCGFADGYVDLNDRACDELDELSRKYLKLDWHAVTRGKQVVNIGF